MKRTFITIYKNLILNILKYVLLKIYFESLSKWICGKRRIRRNRSLGVKIKIKNS